MSDGTLGSFGLPSFRDIMRRYHSERVVFQSPTKGQHYFVSTFEQERCVVQRLDATDSEVITFQLYATRLHELEQSASPISFPNYNNTVTIRTAFVQHGQRA